MSDALRVGIVNPRWTVQRHNTDHVCVLDLARLDRHAPGVQLRFIGTGLQDLWSNASLVGQRLARRSLLPRLPLRPDPRAVQVLYRYGQQVNGLRLHRRNRLPLMSTVGYPSLREVIARGEAFMETEAAQLEAQTADSALLHFHTDAMREQFLQRRPAQHARCVTIPFYLPQLRFASEASVRERFAQPQTRILFVGADGQRKGLDELCEALDAHADWFEARQVQAVVVSQHTPRCQRFRALTHEHRLGRDAVQRLMGESHIYCMVPRHESFGLVFVEAMAAGCAVVADDDLPRQEILDAGRCGRLLPARQPDAIARTLMELVEQRDQACALALAGLARARERYAPEVAARAYATALQRLRV